MEREAHILGIAGWVRNNADSSVEVLAQGTRDQLSGLRARLQRGRARPGSIMLKSPKRRPIPGLTTFRIEGAW